MQIAAVDIGCKVYGEPLLIKIGKGVDSQAWSEIGTANADIDQGFKGFAGAAGDTAVAKSPGESGHAFQRLTDEAADRLVAGCAAAERGVQSGAALGIVDGLAVEQIFDGSG